MNVKTILASDRERIQFALRAAAYFNEHPGVMTYTDAVEGGKLFAIRWANGRSTATQESLLGDIAVRAISLLEANTDKSSRRVVAEKLRAELAELERRRVVSVLVFDMPYDAVLVGDLDVGVER